MQNQLTRKLVLGALFAAIICVVTFALKIPVPGITSAYINAGDSIIYTAGVVMSGPWAAAAAGIGSMFADIIVGSAIYAPATLIVKALMGLIVGLTLYNRKLSWQRCVIVMAIASLVMVAGYGLYEVLIYGFPTAKANVLFNLIQAAGGVIIGVPLALLVRRIIPGSWQEAFKKPEK